MEAPVAPDGTGGNGEAGVSPALSRNCNRIKDFKYGSQVARLYWLYTTSWKGVRACLFRRQLSTHLTIQYFLFITRPYDSEGSGFYFLADKRLIYIQQ